MNANSIQIEIMPVFTAVLWLVCAFTGSAGFFLEYPTSQLAAKRPQELNAEILNVQIASEPATPVMNVLSPSTLEPAQSHPPPLPLPDTIAPSLMPSLMAVTESASLKPKVSAKTAPPHTAPTVTRIIYGQGEGQQPAPEYPRESVLARQQGTVVIRFTVDEQGQVQSAEIITPCHFPLLNQAALRAVTDRWRFPSGAARAYEVTIQFQLRQR